MKQDKARQLLDMLDNVTVNYKTAQEAMLKARDDYEYADRLYRDERIIAIGTATGKNSEQREAEALSSPRIQEARMDVEETKGRFNNAYRLYKQAEADLLYIRDATALLRELS